MIKVLHFTPYYAPAWSKGGVAIASKNLCEKLSTQGYQITDFTKLNVVDNAFFSNKKRVFMIS